MGCNYFRRELYLPLRLLLRRLMLLLISASALQVEFTAEFIAAIFPNAHTGPAG